MPHLRSLLVGGAAGALAALAMGDAPAVRAQSLTCSTDTDSDNGLFLKAAILVLVDVAGHQVGGVCTWQWPRVCRLVTCVVSGWAGYHTGGGNCAAVLRAEG